MHSDQLPISAGTVRTLVDEQFPRWRPLPVTEVRSGGTVSAVFRIGEQLSARFPLGAGYPLPWPVQTWLPGTPATDESHAHSVAFARDLAEFISHLRAIDTLGRTFDGEGRGGDLRSHDGWMESCLQRSEGLPDVARLRRTWARLRELPRDAEDVMSHKDLIPANLLGRDNRLVGVLDVGAFGPADPSLDLVCAWHLLERGPRQVLHDELGSDDLEWQRGQAWAFQQAMGLVWYYVDSNPAMSRLGRHTLERLADG